MMEQCPAIASLIWARREALKALCLRHDSRIRRALGCMLSGGHFMYDPSSIAYEYMV
jgi:hypothetical protein